MNLPKKVEIIEVGLRDGLQNEKVLVSTNQKKRLVDLLVASGIQRLESTSFVHPKIVPQMADAEQMSEYCNDKNITHIVLTPNEKGIERAIATNAPQVALFIGASETFNQKNIRMTIEQSIEESSRVIQIAKEHQLYVRGYISMAFSCPFEGETTYEQVRKIIAHYREQEVDEIILGDTNGQANPKIVFERFTQCKKDFPTAIFGAHFHDTNGFALANSLAALQVGITKFDSAVAELGGCPFSPGATGNVATEKLVRFFTSMGIETSIDEHKLQIAVSYAKELIGK